MLKRSPFQHATLIKDVQLKLLLHGSSRRTLISGIRIIRFQTLVLTEIFLPPRATLRMLKNLLALNGSFQLLPNKNPSQHVTPIKVAPLRPLPHGNFKKIPINGIRITKFQTSELIEISLLPKAT